MKTRIVGRDVNVKREFLDFLRPLHEELKNFPVGEGEAPGRQQASDYWRYDYYYLHMSNVKGEACETSPPPACYAI